MVIRSKKELELELERVPHYKRPSKRLEQYVTPSDIAADLLWEAFMRGSIRGKTVVDLGCGTGKLAYGSILLGASSAICIDLDVEALKAARDFIKRIIERKDLGGLVEFVATDIRVSNPLRGSKECTVIMNPPFGVWSRGADIEFLEEALQICHRVYSIHKRSEGFFKKLNGLGRDLKVKYKVLKVANMKLGMSMPEHYKKVHSFPVILITFNSY